MPTASQMGALRSVVEVRWRLLESYALARQEGLVEPVGLVIDLGHVFARKLGEQVLVSGNWSNDDVRVRVTCMERAALCGSLSAGAPDVALTLRGLRDEPGRWVAVLLAERGLVLTGTWQDLMTATADTAARATRSRAR